MGTPFLGEIKIISWNFAPQGWAFCNGQFLPINQNQALFPILGTTYGGNGQTTFALPDLRGRIPMHMGSGHVEGEKGGQENHTLTLSEMPAHNHFINSSSTTGGLPGPANNDLAGNSTSPYSDKNPDAAMNPLGISNVGGSQPHNNMSPYLTLNFIIALNGIFPSRN